jgi:hypothetical protein
VLTKTITDLAATPNISRTWTYTHNSAGQVLTADGPGADAYDVTTYTYYSCTTGYHCGQLHTVTTAAGHVTTYSNYDASLEHVVSAVRCDARVDLGQLDSGGTGVRHRWQGH